MAIQFLIVDDSLPMRAVIKKTVKAAGYSGANYFEASDGKEALAVLKQQWVDLVLTDYNMPDMDGLELISHMKKDEILSAIPVLVITTEGSQAKIEAFLKHGAAGYIKKPFTPEMIRTKVIEILGETHDDTCPDESCDDLDF